MVVGFSWLDLKMAKNPQCKVGFVSSDQTQNIKTKRGRISIYDLTSSAFKSLSKFNFWREKLPRKEVFSLFIWEILFVSFLNNFNHCVQICSDFFQNILTGFYCFFWYWAFVTFWITIFFIIIFMSFYNLCFFENDYKLHAFKIFLLPHNEQNS